MASPSRTRPLWTFAIVSVALFMVVLDNLVVTTALPSIRADLGGGLQALEWTVNAYTLTFAVLLLTGAALGDRFGRRRMFVIGLGLFTLASAGAALAPTTGALIAARALQGAGAAIVTPLTLTLLSTAFPAEKRGLAIGAWSGISGLGVALGPLVGGAVVDGISWHWIFWLNVPIGLVLAPLAYRHLAESYGPAKKLDLPGLALGGVGLLGIVYGIVRGAELGWTSTTVLGALLVGAIASPRSWPGSCARPPRCCRCASSARAPSRPPTASRSRCTSASSARSSCWPSSSRSCRGSRRWRPACARCRGRSMPMFVAPIAGLLSDRIGSRPLMVAGLTLQATGIAMLAVVSSPTVPYSELVLPFVLAGTGMALVFAPTANAVLSAVRPVEAGQASGATNAIREVGGTLGVAVLASVFAANGSYASPQAFTDGMTSAIWVGAAVLAAGALIALLVPGKRRATEAETAPAAVGQVREPSLAA